MSDRPGSLARLQRKLESVLSAEPPDYAAGATIIETMLAQPGAEDEIFLVDLMERLADCYAESGRFDEAIAAMDRALALGWKGRPDGRARIADFLLRAGRAEEAHALYAAVKADTPDDVWLYNAAGLDYAAQGDQRCAYEWLTEGLNLALRTDDPEHLVAQLSDLRRESLTALGLPLDELEEHADRFLTERSALKSRASPTGTSRSGMALESEPYGPEMQQARAGVKMAVGWFPPEQFPSAISRWPSLPGLWGAESYQDYCQELQRSLLRFAKHGMNPDLAPIDVEAYLRWCAEKDRDAASSPTRAQYAAVVTRQGGSLPWPPGRNEPCWCRSGRKYKRCCGAVELGPDDDAGEGSDA